MSIQANAKSSGQKSTRKLNKKQPTDQLAADAPVAASGEILAQAQPESVARVDGSVAQSPLSSSVEVADQEVVRGDEAAVAEAVLTAVQDGVDIAGQSLLVAAQSTSGKKEEDDDKAAGWHWSDALPWVAALGGIALIARSDDDDAAPLAPAGAAGVVWDTPVANAIVFRDSDGDGMWKDVNGDGVWQAGDEFITSTNEAGEFSGLGGSGLIVATSLDRLVATNGRSGEEQVLTRYTRTQSITDSRGNEITGDAIDIGADLAYGTADDYVWSGAYVAPGGSGVYVTGVSTLAAAYLRAQGVESPTQAQVIAAANELAGLFASDYEGGAITTYTQAIAFFTGSLNAQITKLMGAVAGQAQAEDADVMEAVNAAIATLAQAVIDLSGSNEELDLEFDAGNPIDLTDAEHLQEIFGYDALQADAYAAQTAEAGPAVYTIWFDQNGSAVASPDFESIATITRDGPLGNITVLASEASADVALDVQPEAADSLLLQGSLMQVHAAASSSDASLEVRAVSGVAEGLQVRASAQDATASAAVYAGGAEYTQEVQYYVLQDYLEGQELAEGDEIAVLLEDDVTLSYVISSEDLAADDVVAAVMASLVEAFNSQAQSAGLALTVATEYGEASPALFLLWSDSRDHAVAEVQFNEETLFLGLIQGTLVDGEPVATVAGAADLEILGDVTVEADAAGASASADVVGNVSIDGAIGVMANGTGSYAEADFNSDFDGETEDSRITLGGGTVTVDAQGTGSCADVHLHDAVGNAGAVVVGAEGEDANAYLHLSNEGASTDLLTVDSLTVTASNGSLDASASASAELDGNLSLTSEILVSAAGSNGYAYLNGDANSIVLGGGDLTLRAEGTSAQAEADLYNASGTTAAVSVDAEGESAFASLDLEVAASAELSLASLSVNASNGSADSGADAYAYVYGQSSDSTVSISGDISVAASGQSADAYLDVNDSAAATQLGGGAITVTADGAEASADAYIYNAGGNAGAVTVSAGGASEGETEFQGYDFVRFFNSADYASGDVFTFEADGATLSYTLTSGDVFDSSVNDVLENVIASFNTQVADQSLDFRFLTPDEYEVDGLWVDWAVPGNRETAVLKLNDTTIVLGEAEGQMWYEEYNGAGAIGASADLSVVVAGDSVLAVQSLTVSADFGSDATARISGAVGESADGALALAGDVTVSAIGLDARALAELNGPSDGNTVLGSDAGGSAITVTADGSSSTASADIYQASGAAAAVTVSASSDAYASLDLEVDGGGALTIDSVTVSAIDGDATAAQAYASIYAEDDGTVAITGDIAVTAAGVQSTAWADIDPVLGQATDAGVAGSNLSVSATADSADADLTLRHGEGTIDTITVQAVPGEFTGEARSYIIDGGDDQYDDGNFIGSDFASEIAYSPVVVSGNFGAGSQNVAVYEDSIFGMLVTGNSSDVFEVSGELGSDGSGTEDLITEVAEYNGYRAIFQRTYGDDPSINRVFIYQASDAVQAAELDGDTNNDDLTISGLSGVDTFAYFVLFGNDFDPIHELELTAFFHAAVDNVLDGGDGPLPIEAMQTAFYEESTQSTLRGEMSLYEGFTDDDDGPFSLGEVPGADNASASADVDFSGDVQGDLTVLAAGASADATLRMDSVADGGRVNLLGGDLDVDATAYSADALLELGDAAGSADALTVDASASSARAEADVNVAEGASLVIGMIDVNATSGSAEARVGVYGMDADSSVQVTGPITVLADAEDAYARAYLVDEDTRIGSVTLGGESGGSDITVTAAGYSADAHAHIYNAGGAAGTVLVQGSGDYTYAHVELEAGAGRTLGLDSLTVNQTGGDPGEAYAQAWTASESADVAISGDITVSASGAYGYASAEINLDQDHVHYEGSVTLGHATVSGVAGSNLLVSATADSADAELFLANGQGAIADITVDATAEDASADANLDFSGDVQADISVLASGESSDASLQLYSDTADGRVNLLGSDITVSAQSDSADAHAWISSASGEIGEISVEASSQYAQAGVSVASAVDGQHLQQRVSFAGAEALTGFVDSRWIYLTIEGETYEYRLDQSYYTNRDDALTEIVRALRADVMADTGATLSWAHDALLVTWPDYAVHAPVSFETDGNTSNVHTTIAIGHAVPVLAFGGDDVTVRASAAYAEAYASVTHASGEIGDISVLADAPNDSCDANANAEATLGLNGALAGDVIVAATNGEHNFASLDLHTDGYGSIGLAGEDQAFTVTASAEATQAWMGVDGLAGMLGSLQVTAGAADAQATAQLRFTDGGLQSADVEAASHTAEAVLVLDQTVRGGEIDVSGEGHAALTFVVDEHSATPASVDLTGMRSSSNDVDDLWGYADIDLMARWEGAGMEAGAGRQLGWSGLGDFDFDLASNDLWNDRMVVEGFNADRDSINLLLQGDPRLSGWADDVSASQRQEVAYEANAYTASGSTDADFENQFDTLMRDATWYFDTYEGDAALGYYYGEITVDVDRESGYDYSYTRSFLVYDFDLATDGASGVIDLGTGSGSYGGDYGAGLGSMNVSDRYDLAFQTSSYLDQYHSVNTGGHVIENLTVGAYADGYNWQSLDFDTNVWLGDITVEALSDWGAEAYLFVSNDYNLELRQSDIRVTASNTDWEGSADAQLTLDGDYSAITGSINSLTVSARESADARAYLYDTDVVMHDITVQALDYDAYASAEVDAGDMFFDQSVVTVQAGSNEACDGGSADYARAGLDIYAGGSGTIAELNVLTVGWESSADAQIDSFSGDIDQLNVEAEGGWAWASADVEFDNTNGANAMQGIRVAANGDGGPAWAEAWIHATNPGSDIQMTGEGDIVVSASWNGSADLDMDDMPVSGQVGQITVEANDGSSAYARIQGLDFSVTHVRDADDATPASDDSGIRVSATNSSTAELEISGYGEYLDSAVVSAGNNASAYLSLDMNGYVDTLDIAMTGEDAYASVDLTQATYGGAVNISAVSGDIDAEVDLSYYGATAASIVVDEGISLDLLLDVADQDIPYTSQATLLAYKVQIDGFTANDTIDFGGEWGDAWSIASGDYWNYEENWNSVSLAQLFSDANTELDGTVDYYFGVSGGNGYLFHDEDGAGITTVVELLGVTTFSASQIAGYEPNVT